MKSPAAAAQGLLEFGVAPDMSQIWLDGEIAVRSMRGWSGHTSVVLVPNPNGVQHDRAPFVPGVQEALLTWAELAMSTAREPDRHCRSVSGRTQENSS